MLALTQQGLGAPSASFRATPCTSGLQARDPARRPFSHNVGIVIATVITAGLAAPFLAGNMNRRITTELVSVDGAAP